MSTKRQLKRRHLEIDGIRASSLVRKVMPWEKKHHIRAKPSRSNGRQPLERRHHPLKGGEGGCKKNWDNIENQHKNQKVRKLGGIDW